MSNRRIDDIARAMASGFDRRTVLRQIVGLSLGGVLAFRQTNDVAANHKARHCSKLGKRCHRHKDCCGVCGPAGFCLSCDGVLVWVDFAERSVSEIESIARGVIAMVDEMADHGEYDSEAVESIRTAAGAVTLLTSDVSAAITPPAAGDPLRTLLELLAAEADALATYLDQIAESAFIVTGNRLVEALVVVLADVPDYRAELAALGTDCAP